MIRLAGLCVLTLAACGDNALAPDAAPIQAAITSFRVDQPVLARGNTTRLVAKFTGTSATIDQGVGTILAGVPISVAPTVATTYTLTVTGETGTTATATVDVDVFDHVAEVVNTNASGAGSLAAAVTVANTAAGSTAITFTLPEPSTIELGATLVSTGEVTILGPGANKLTVSGMDQRRLFFVDGGELTMSGVTLTHGLGAGGKGGAGLAGGGGGGAAGMGGAVFINAGTVTLQDIAISNSVARGGAGGGNSSGLSNGGGGGGFGGDGNDGSSTTVGSGGMGGAGGALGGTGGTSGANAIGDGGGGGGGGAGVQEDGGAGGFGAGGGGFGGFPDAGAGGFGGGAGGGANPVPGMFGGTSAQGGGGGGAGLGGAIFVRTGTLVVSNSSFTANQAIAGLGGNLVASPGLAKGGAIFSLVPTVTLTFVTHSNNVAADAAGTETDSVDVYLTP